MTIDYRDHIVEQTAQSRYRDGRHERLEGDQWVPWARPRDRAGTEEARRVMCSRPRRSEAA